MYKRILATLAIAGLCSCSGAGGSSPVALKTSTPLATTSPATSNASARFTITVPKANTADARGRGPAPKYISSSTLSVIITLVSVNGTPYAGTPSTIASNLTTTNPNCAGSPLTCSVSAPAVAGTDIFDVVTYDAIQSSTNPSPPAGNELSRATTSVNIVAGTANTVTTPLVLSGVASEVDLTISPDSVSEGTATSVTVVVNVRDAQNNIIVGTYSDTNGNALTVNLKDGDTTGATKLTPSSVTSSSTSVSLSYDGSDISTAALSPSVTGGTFAGKALGANLAVVAGLPTLTSLSQNLWIVGTSATSFTQTLTGTNFTSDSTVGVSGMDVSVSDVTFNSSTSLTATFTVAASAATGSDAVTVTAPESGTSASLPLSIEQGVFVTSNADTMPGTPTSPGPGVAGDLRYAMQNVPASGAIVLNCGIACTITPAAPLPPITTSYVIDGYGSPTIDGAKAYRVFFVDGSTTNATIENLNIQNALALGGAGAQGGGGGLGAGAGIFVTNATVTIANVAFANMIATGGAGSHSSSDGSGGGGGLAFAGAASVAAGGGGGVVTAGNTTTNCNSGTQLEVGAGGGAGYGGCDATESGSGGFAYLSQSAGSDGSAFTRITSSDTTIGGTGGEGGFGGGGGGGEPELDMGGTANYIGGSGGSGGFGGGGGGGGSCDCSDGSSDQVGAGGVGGAGGGGGGSGSGVLVGIVNDPGGGQGGALGDGTITGGSGGVSGNTSGAINGYASGGGGAAAGAAIFNVSGTLTISGSSASCVVATGGAPGSNATKGGSDASPLWNNGGSVNGSSTKDGIGSALPSVGACGAAMMSRHPSARQR